MIKRLNRIGLVVIKTILMSTHGVSPLGMKMLTYCTKMKIKTR